MIEKKKQTVTPKTVCYKLQFILEITAMLF